MWQVHKEQETNFMLKCLVTVQIPETQKEHKAYMRTHDIIPKTLFYIRKHKLEKILSNIKLLGMNSL